MDFYSHIKRDQNGNIINKKLLKVHLLNTAENIKKEIEINTYNLPFDRSIFIAIAEIIALSHDFGKYTTYFQDKMLKEIANDYSKHGFISAVFGFWLVRKYLTIQNKLDESHLKHLPLVAFQIIKHHHGDLNDVSKDVVLIGYEEMLRAQITNIKTNWQEIEKDYQENFKAVNLDVLPISEFLNYFADSGDEDYRTQAEYDLRSAEYYFSFAETDEKLQYYYFLINQYIYSLLISNDKIDAANAGQIERKSLTAKLVGDYRNTEFKLTIEFKESVENKLKAFLKTKETDKKIRLDINLNELREAVYQEVNMSLDNIDFKRNRIFTITSPTGSGKTLTALSAALKIRDKVNTGNKPRIIYSLPFTSIIEQNYEVIYEVLEQIKDFKDNQESYLLKHHYFSNPVYQVESEQKPIEEALLYIENWDSEIVVTTFIQLFYTLVGYKNKALKKFHKFANSIIVLDEVQNIPLKYWPLVNNILKLITEYFDSYVILLTATKPLIFNSIEAKELLPNSEDYFKCKTLNRTKLVKCLEISSIDKLFEHFEKQTKNLNSALVIANTIKSSMEIFKALGENIKFGDYKKIYLSTNITPFERKERIQAIKVTICAIQKLKEENKEIPDSNKIIVVSTQLIEAGVDIDMDLIYRDLAPLDSIIQSAGRANRNGKSTVQSSVFITQLQNENKKDYSSMIYDKISIEATAGTKKNPLLADCTEDKYLDKINKYFDESVVRKSQNDSKLILKSLREFYFYDQNPQRNKRLPISEFKLIEDLPNYVSLFIELDVGAISVWKKFTDLRVIDDILIRKNEFKKLKGDFYQYVISIPDKCVNGICEKIFDDLYYLSNEKVNDSNNKIFDATVNAGTGYNRELENWIF